MHCRTGTRGGVQVSKYETALHGSNVARLGGSPLSTKSSCGGLLEPAGPWRQNSQPRPPPPTGPHPHRPWIWRPPLSLRFSSRNYVFEQFAQRSDPSLQHSCPHLAEEGPHRPSSSPPRRCKTWRGPGWSDRGQDRDPRRTGRPGRRGWVASLNLRRTTRLEREKKRALKRAPRPPMSTPWSWLH